VFIQSTQLFDALGNHQDPPYLPHHIALNHDITLNAVSFAYGNKKAVQAISCVFKAHQITAIIGHSGAGKSTLADILLGLLSPQEGFISVDEHRLSIGEAHAWREKISYIPQETLLFNDSVRANLLWAAPHATESEIEHVLKITALDKVIAELPQQLATPIGDRGLHLSGGERQRLALARGLLRNPSVLILDEATSALDAYNEQLIYQTLQALKHTMTIIVISHRWRCAQAADHLVVLHEGRLLEEGALDKLTPPTANHLLQVFQC
jgi:ATP-binding cassette subfamily C protein